MQLEADSLERLVPEAIRQDDATGGETLALHVERYVFAARWARAGRLLDLACGVGYGTRLLAERCPDVEEVLGVDISESAVTYASERYGGERTRFTCSNALSFDDPRGFDTIVSLETVEHVSDPAALVARLATLLRPGGMLVASVPTTPSVDLNPHHLSDFSERSFRRLFEPHGLRERGCLRQVQPVRIGSLLRRSEARMRDVRRNLPAWYCAHPGALLRRAAATMRYGFSNRYLTVAWQADG